MSISLYSDNSILNSLKDYFSSYFAQCTKPIAYKLLFFALALLAVDTALSIRFLYQHFLLWATGGAMASWDYLFATKAKIDDAQFLEVTVRKAMGIIPQEQKDFPILLCLDDTMIAKYGHCIEGVAKMFDHADMKILPYSCSQFHDRKKRSPQEARFLIGKQIKKEIY